MTGPKAKVGQPAPHWRGKAVVQEEIKEISLEDYKVHPCHQTGNTHLPCQQVPCGQGKGECLQCAACSRLHRPLHIDHPFPAPREEATPAITLARDGMHLMMSRTPFMAWLRNGTAQCAACQSGRLTSRARLPMSCSC